MTLFKILKFIYKSKHNHFLSVEFDDYIKWKILIKFFMKMNPNYISCEIFRKQYKYQNNIVVIGLKYYGKNVKRRVNGYAKEFIKGKIVNCIYCNRKLNDNNATSDHIVPISLGGNNTKVNLIICCHSCNGERGNKDFKTYLREKNIKYSNVKYPFI